MGAPIESLPATSRIASHGEYNLLGYKSLEYNFYLPAFRRIAERGFTEVFDVDPTDALREIAFNMNNGGSIVIATLRDTGEAIGYSTQRILRPPSEGWVRVLYISTRVVQTDHQRKGVGTALLRFVHNLHDAPDIVGGRTQNPAIVKSYMNSDLLTKLYPFDELYGRPQPMEEELTPIQKVLRYVAAQTKDRHPVDLSTGLMKAVYKEGSSHAYDNDQASPEIQKIFIRMRCEFGVDPDNGDGLIVLGVKKGRTNFIE